MNTYDLFKGASHKYKYRKLTGHDKKTGRPKYRYYYDYHHGGGIHSAEHFVAGSKFEFEHKGQRGHFHIDSAREYNVTITHDETGHSETITRAELSALLRAQHQGALQETAKKRRETYERMKEKTPKHIGLKLAKRRAEELEGLAGAPKPKEEASDLEQSILKKHSVSASQLSNHFEIWEEEGVLKPQDKFFQKKMRSLAGENNRDKPPKNPYDRFRNFDKWVEFMRESSKIANAQSDLTTTPEARAKRAEPSLKAYNDLLERSAKENRGVLKAVEEYRANLAKRKYSMEWVEGFEKLKREVSKACAGFDTTPTQESHEDHWCNKGKRKAFPRVSGHLAKVEEIFKTAYPDRKKKTQFDFQKSVRANYSDRGYGHARIVLENYTDLKTASHEMGHSLEYMEEGNNTVLDVGTLTHLTRIERGKIKTIYPTGKREEAFDDEYTELYTGKLYEKGSTELVSMGVQEILGSPKTQAEDQANFALRDPHHFLITYGILKGYAKL